MKKKATNLITCFESLIPPQWKLSRENNYWQIMEDDSSAKNRLFQISSGKSVAFSLDKKENNLNLFPFFSEQLSGVRQVNDALIVFGGEDQSYIVAVEMKTSLNKKKEAMKQIESGRLFMNWVIQLLWFHGHYSDSAVPLFIGIVSLTPRQQPRKGSTRRCAELPDSETSPYGDYPVFLLKNHPRASISDLLKKLPNSYTTTKRRA